MTKRLMWLTLIVSFSGAANEQALTFDRVIPETFSLAFPNERNIVPEPGEFEVKSYALMSNESGERWAIVTLTNLSEGRRTLTHRHLKAQVANGERISPRAFSQTFKGNETLSITINFGDNKFPLMSIYSRTET